MSLANILEILTPKFLVSFGMDLRIKCYSLFYSIEGTAITGKDQLLPKTNAAHKYCKKLKRVSNDLTDNVSALRL